MTQEIEPLPQPTDAAQPIRVAVGAAFTIVLAANHTTGFSWQLARGSHRSGVEHVGTDYQGEPHAAGMVGVGGWEIWTFRAVARHRTALTFHYRQPFDRHAPPAE